MVKNAESTYIEKKCNMHVLKINMQVLFANMKHSHCQEVLYLHHDPFWYMQRGIKKKIEYI